MAPKEAPSSITPRNCTVHQHSSPPNSLRNSSDQYFNICIQNTKRECRNSQKLLGKLEHQCTVQTQRLIPLGAHPDATLILSSLADSVLQVHFDVVCLFTILESQVDRSYLYLVWTQCCSVCPFY